MSREDLLAAIKIADELLVRKARESFAGFCKYMQPADMQPVLHHLVMCEAMDSVARGETKKLMLMLPPGAAKSSFASVLLPQYFMGKNPQLSVIQASHTAELAERFGRKVRNAIADPSFQRVFPGVGVAADNAAAGRWATNHGGEYTAFGVGGSVTGRRGDCLVGSTLVETPSGHKEIKDVEVGEYVLSHSFIHSSAVYRRVVAVSRRRASETFRVHSDLGCVVEATGNHRIYCGSNWKETQAIVDGDVLLCVLPEAVEPGAIRVGKEVQGRPGLSTSVQSELRNTSQQQQSRHEAGGDLQPLQEGNVVWVQARSKNLLCGVQEGDSQKEVDSREEGAAEKLRCVRSSLQACKQNNSVKMLLNGLQEPDALRNHEGREQPDMEGWGCNCAGAGRETTGVQVGTEECNEAGSCCLRCMQIGREVGVSSRQPESIGQQLQQSCDALPVLSHKAARGGEKQTQVDFVSLVERVRHPEGVDVYDIEVDETHNFYANGILVHNCIIIDDPVKSREDADSERIREKTWDWYVNDLLTRMKPNARLVIACTRWHEDDLMGRILARERDQWKVIKIPMLAGQNDILGRKEGERLWKEWFTEEMIEQAQRDPRSWISLYQQEPRPAEGAEFKRTWIQRYTNPPKITNKVILVDPAGDPSRTNGKRKKSDYTAMWVVALGSDENAYIVDGLRDRLNLTQRADALFALHKKHKPMQVRYEQYGLQADVEHVKSEMERRQYRFAIKEVGGNVEKNARIRRLVPWFEGGRIWLPSSMPRETVEGKPYDVVADFVDQEYATFPVGRYDDSFDCLARLAEPGLTLPYPQEDQDEDPRMAVWATLDEITGY